MGARAKICVILALAGTCGLLVLPSMASAKPRSGVTIHHYYGDVLKGYVFSSKPRLCAGGRTVKVFRQTGKKQRPNRDVKVAKVNAVKRGSGKYLWDVNPGRPGHYYAQVPATADCQGDSSKTVMIRKRPDTKISDVQVDNHQVTIYYFAVGGVEPYHFKCKLDHRRYPRCPRTFKGLRRGRHVFKVWAVGHDGKRDPTPAKRGFHISR